MAGSCCPRRSGAASRWAWLLSSGLWLVSSVAPGLSVTGGEVKLKVVASDNRDALLRLARDPLTIRRTRFDALRGLADLMDDAQAAAPRLPGHVLALYGEKDTIVPVEAASRAWRNMPADVRRGPVPVRLSPADARQGPGGGDRGRDRLDRRTNPRRCPRARTAGRGLGWPGGDRGLAEPRRAAL